MERRILALGLACVLALPTVAHGQSAGQPAFADLYAELRSGPAYRADVSTGRIDGQRRNADGEIHPYVLLVPETYDPERRYPVRIWLHGGISRPAWTEPGAWWRDFERIASEEWITAIPAGWVGSKWWDASQSENLAGLLDDLKATYNVDENRVSLLGISDGASGVYFHAAKSTTPYAAFLAFIGHVAVVQNPAMAADGAIQEINLAQKPLYIVNTERDRLYPYATVLPYVERWRRAGADVTFRPIDGAGHDLSWMPDEAPAIRAFLAGAARDPLPDRVTWQAERTDRYNRAHWVEITALGPAAGETRFARIFRDFGRGPWGRVRVERKGNRVEVETEGVRSYRLLLSPDEFDFEKDVEVVTNGVRSFRGRVEPDVDVLRRWHARDRDRTMLFGAELTIELPAPD